MKRLAAALPLLTAAALMAGCLSLPDGLQVTVSPDGCTPDRSYCMGRPANYYYPPTRTVVMAPGQGLPQTAHEVCHGHQHEVILEATGREPDITLSPWYTTAEGAAFLAATGWRADGGTGDYGPTFYPNETPWDFLGFNALEDAAWTCSKYLTDPEDLRARSPERYAWAAEWLK